MPGDVRLGKEKAVGCPARGPCVSSSHSMGSTGTSVLAGLGFPVDFILGLALPNKDDHIKHLCKLNVSSQER